MIFALIGNQNCGKTTLFNQLTGANQHVGNFPGVTAEKIVVSKEHDITFCLYNGLKLTERGGGQDAVAHANRL